MPEEHPFASYLVALKARRRPLAEIRRVDPSRAHESVLVIKYLAGWATPNALGAQRTPFILVSLFARHPQHTKHRPFAEAVRLLGRDEALDYRFDQLVLAPWDILPDKLYGMIRRLKQHDLGFDWGMLFEDLVRLEAGRGSDPRLRWARTYYRAPSGEQDGQEES